MRVILHALIRALATPSPQTSLLTSDYFTGRFRRARLDGCETERSFAEVTLDRQFSTTANRFGKFEFRIRYLPDDCIVSLAGRTRHPSGNHQKLLPSRQGRQAHATASALSAPSCCGRTNSARQLLASVRRPRAERSDFRVREALQPCGKPENKQCAPALRRTVGILTYLPAPPV